MTNQQSQATLKAEIELSHCGSSATQTPDKLILVFDDHLLLTIAKCLAGVRVVGLAMTEIVVGLPDDPELLENGAPWLQDEKDASVGDFEPSSFWLKVQERQLTVEVWDEHGDDELLGSVAIGDVPGLREALAAHTTQALDDATKALSPPVPENGTMQKWEVRAVYTDNDQPMATEVQSRTALEAAVMVSVRSLSNEDGGAIGIFEVVPVPDRGEGGLMTNSTQELDLFLVRETLTALLRLAEMTANVGIPTGDEALFIKWLGLVLVENDRDSDLQHLLDRESIHSTNAKFSGSITASSATRPSDALLALCDRVERIFDGVVIFEAQGQDDARKVHQVRAMCTYFAGPLNDSQISNLVEVEFPEDDDADAQDDHREAA